MNRRSWVRWLDSFSDNRQSKIENLKWVGRFALVLTFAMCGACGAGAAADKNPAGRIPN